MSTRAQRWLRLLAPAAPYVAVAVGLYGMHSAWAALLGYHLLMAVVLTAARQWGGAGALFAPREGWLQPVGLFLGFAAGVPIYLGWPWLGMSVDLPATLAGFGLTRQSWPAFMLLFCLVNPWLEELFWRGYLGSADIRPTAHDLAFAGYHLFVVGLFVPWPWLIPTMLVLVGAAWLWRQSARLPGGPSAALAMHAAADLSIIGAVYVRAGGG